MTEMTISTDEFSRLPTSEEAEAIQRMQGGIQAVFMGAPILADVDRIVTSTDWADGSLTVAAQPDVPRNLTATLTDVDDSVTGLLTITGTDVRGRTITETMEPDGAGGGKTLTGTKIFASVTSCVITGTAGAAGGTDLIVIGVGSLIGVPFDLDAYATVRYVYVGAVLDTAAVAATGVSLSGITPNETLDGSKIMWAILQLGRTL